MNFKIRITIKYIRVFEKNTLDNKKQDKMLINELSEDVKVEIIT